MKSNLANTSANEKNAGPLAPVRSPPPIWQVVVIGLIAIIFTAGWLYSYEYLGKLIWENDFVIKNRWLIPVGALFFSLIVGLALKYLRSPSVIHGGFVESIKGEGREQGDYRIFPGTLISSYGSLLSGASVGPEGPLAYLVQGIAAWTKEKFMVIEQSSFAWMIAAIASAFNGIIGSPLFTTIFATELQASGGAGLTFLAWNLLAGVIGYLFFTLLKLTVFASSIPFPPISQFKVEYIGYAILLGLLGTILATFIGLVFQLWGRIMGWVLKIFKNNVIFPVLIAGAITGLVCYIYPEIQFSGAGQIQRVIAFPSIYGAGMLVLLAILKILMLGLAFKSGYLGGPIFPTLFAATMIALALSLGFPDVPVSIFVTCLEVAMVALAFGLPLTAILLVAAVNSSDTYTIGLLVVAAVTAMIAGGNLRRYIVRLVARST